MPVIINEFEVLAGEPEEPRRQEDREEKQKRVPTPHDIVLVIRHWQARLARVRAY